MSCKYDPVDLMDVVVEAIKFCGDDYELVKNYVFDCLGGLGFEPNLIEKIDLKMDTSNRETLFNAECKRIDNMLKKAVRGSMALLRATWTRENGSVSVSWRYCISNGYGKDPYLIRLWDSYPPSPEKFFNDTATTENLRAIAAEMVKYEISLCLDAFLRTLSRNSQECINPAMNDDKNPCLVTTNDGRVYRIGRLNNKHFTMTCLKTGVQRRYQTLDYMAYKEMGEFEFSDSSSVSGPDAFVRAWRVAVARIFPHHKVNQLDMDASKEPDAEACGPRI